MSRRGRAPIPFHAVGDIYLAGPFEGAPLSLVAITPALAGPYDYGTVVVRVAIRIDPHDAHVIADSETVPAIIGGVPIRMRSIQVNIDKPNFMINPTNCDPFTVDSQGIGDQGTVAGFSSPFQAVNCYSLPFAPTFAVRQLGGHKATPRSKDPALQFDLRTRPGDANIRSVAVTLPKAFAIDQRHLGNICSRAQLAAEHCAGRQPIGAAVVETPLLEQPLRGPAYAVSGFGKLPHVVFILGGQVADHAGSRILLGEGATENHRAGRPRHSGRPLPPQPLRREQGLHRQHTGSLRRAGGLEDRDHRPERTGGHAAGPDEDRLRKRKTGAEGPASQERGVAEHVGGGPLQR